jgi:hypothetical protein
MKLFHCDSCQQVLFFENVQCTRCGHALAYLPDRALLSAIEPETSNNQPGQGPGNNQPGQGPASWRALAPEAGGVGYRLCQNYTVHAVCNWAVPADDPNPFCRACRLNHMIPNLDNPGAKAAWHRMEIAKRRLVCTLLEMGLPLETKDENPTHGLAFDFLQEDRAKDAPKVFTGHDEGLITINIAEADDPFREKMRVQLGEAYRTLLGHFRHEIGHYYWNRLVRDDQRKLAAFRDKFGDERVDYQAELQRHYDNGPPPNWPDRFISSYASMHPWEDWAETWAHYLHMADTLQTARAYGLSLRPSEGKPAETSLTSTWLDLHSFEDLISGWIPLTVALNSLNRSMGTSDSYPFVLSKTAIEKLRFVHDVIEGWRDTPAVTDR